jgi:hypothetical protein
VTGAEDEMAYVWETHSGDVVLHCKGHKVGKSFSGMMCHVNEETVSVSVHVVICLQIHKM